MAHTIQGIGTTFIGKRDFHCDNSYVTTEWVVFAYFPIAPRRSLRVVETGGGDTSRFPFLFSSKYTYRVLETTRPNWKQVLYVYGFAVLYIGWIISYLIYGPDTKNTEGVALWFAAVAVPFIIPYALRWYARLHKLP